LLDAAAKTTSKLPRLFCDGAAAEIPETGQEQQLQFLEGAERSLSRMRTF
jgi:hypothetical protein